MLQNKSNISLDKVHRDIQDKIKALTEGCEALLRTKVPPV